MNKYDYLIVGAGLFGSVCARELTKRGKKVLVIDQRDHIGGNCYDVVRPENNHVHVSLYGGHYGHTNNEIVYNYIKQYTPLYEYAFVSKANVNGVIYSYPVNLMTFQQIWGITKPEYARKKIEEETKPYKKDTYDNFEEKLLGMAGKTLYEMFYYGYNLRHWGVEPRYVPPEVINRIVIRYNYDDRYFSDRFQYMPVFGYTFMFKNLLKDIEVKLETPFETKMLNYADKVIYTGCIDEYYEYCFGELEYRGVRHVYTDENTGSPMITYTDWRDPYNRKFCYNYSSFDGIISPYITAVEYPDDTSKYYPVNTSKNMDIYKKYRNIANNRVIFGGRLGMYKYINMDKTIELALELIETL